MPLCNGERAEKSFSFSFIAVEIATVGFSFAFFAPNRMKLMKKGKIVTVKPLLFCQTLF
jgi:hypothetical protein